MSYRATRSFLPLPFLLLRARAVSARTLPLLQAPLALLMPELRTPLVSWACAPLPDGCEALAQNARAYARERFMASPFELSAPPPLYGLARWFWTACKTFRPENVIKFITASPSVYTPTVIADIHGNYAAHQPRA